MIHFAYPSPSKGLLAVGSMVRFPIHKGYCGKPAHHTGVSTLSGLLIRKVLNPRPEGRNALGLITIYPRPDEPISDPLQPYQPQPPISHHLSVRPLSQLQRRSQTISIHMLYWRCQHIRKTNRSKLSHALIACSHLVSCFEGSSAKYCKCVNNRLTITRINKNIPILRYPIYYVKCVTWVVNTIIQIQIRILYKSYFSIVSFYPNQICFYT